MRRKEVSFRLVIPVAFGVALVYLVWRYAPSPAESCDACARPVHSQTRTVALVDNRREVFCCPACALTAHHQTGKIVRISELSDYQTGKPVSPNDAYVVEGSAVNLCVRKSALMTLDKRIIPLVSDRCKPSVIAFALAEAAGKIRQEQGGTLLRFEELAASYQR